MLARLTDFSDSLDLFDELRRQMDAVWDDWGVAHAPSAGAGVGPRISVLDGGAELVVEADVPGLTDKDLDITLHDGILTLVGERKVGVPAGYKPRRQERTGYRFSRSFALPAKVDPEKTTAVVKDGVLTITLAKAPESRPRQITVKA